MKQSLIPVFLVFGLSALGCITDDSGRCNGVYRWNPDIGGCVLKPLRDTDEDGKKDAGAGSADGGVDDSTDESVDEAGPTGLGEACSSNDDCADYDADYCDQPPGSVGTCTVKDCNLDPDDCPLDYTCCEFLYEPMNFCLPPETWEAFGSVVCGNY